jgi:hypothetical protein
LKITGFDIFSKKSNEPEQGQCLDRAVQAYTEANQQRLSMSAIAPKADSRQRSQYPQKRPSVALPRNGAMGQQRTHALRHKRKNQDGLAAVSPEFD